MNTLANYKNYMRPTRTVKETIFLNSLLTVLIYICIADIFLYGAIFLENSSLQLMLIGIKAMLSLIGVVLVFGNLNSIIKVGWCALLILFFIPYVIHLSGLEYFCNTISFLGILTILPYVAIRKRTIKILLAFWFLYMVFMVVFTKSSRNFVNNHWFINPNLSSIMIFLTIFVVFCFIKVKYHKFKLRIVLLMIALTILQLTYKGRSALIGTFLVFVNMLFPKLERKLNARKCCRLTFFIHTLSVCFVAFYSITLFKIIGKGNLYIMGKDIFTGRQMIWQDAFSQLSGNWLFGIGNRLRSMKIYGNLFTNLHNQSMGYLVTFGLLAFISYVLLLSSLIKNLYKKNYVLVAIFILILSLMAYFETLLYSSDNIRYILPILVVIGYFDKKNKRSSKVEEGYSLLLVRDFKKVAQN